MFRAALPPRATTPDSRAGAVTSGQPQLSPGLAGAIAFPPDADANQMGCNGSFPFSSFKEILLTYNLKDGKAHAFAELLS